MLFEGEENERFIGCAPDLGMETGEPWSPPPMMVVDPSPPSEPPDFKSLVRRKEEVKVENPYTLRVLNMNDDERRQLVHVQKGKEAKVLTPGMLPEESRQRSGDQNIGKGRKKMLFEGEENGRFIGCTPDLGMEIG